jgi:hypothetical protein
MMRTNAKHLIGDFDGFFEGAKTFFDPKIVLSAAKGSRGKFKKAGYIPEPFDHSQEQIHYEIGPDSIKCSM